VAVISPPCPLSDSALPVRASARVAAVARLLDCHHSEVRRLVRNGELQAYTHGTRGVRVFLDSISTYQERRLRDPVGVKAPGLSQQRKARPATAAFHAALAGLKAKGLA